MIYYNVITHKKTVITLLIITTSLLTYGYSQNRVLNNLLEQKFYDDPIVHKITTKYQHIVITKNNTTNDIRTYINGNTQFSSLDEERYHDALVHTPFSISTNRSNVLILGGGDGLALREVLKYKDVESVTLVDLDPEMVKLAKDNKILSELNKDAFKDARIIVKKTKSLKDENVKGVYLTNNDKEEHVAQVTVYNIDADLFIRELNNELYDVIIIDFPDPSSIELSKLYSKRFYYKVSKHLTRDGVMSIQSTSPFHAKEAYLAIGNTLRASGLSAVPYHTNVPSFGDWGFYLIQKDVHEKEIRNKIKEVHSIDVSTTFITPELLKSYFSFGKGELISKNNCVNTLMYPCLLTQYTDYSWINE